MPRTSVHHQSDYAKGPKTLIGTAGSGLQAEAVAALVNARTDEAADSALAGMTGGLGAAVAAMRSDTLNLLAELEVGTSNTSLYQSYPFPIHLLLTGAKIGWQRLGRVHSSLFFHWLDL